MSGSLGIFIYVVAPKGFRVLLINICMYLFFILLPTAPQRCALKQVQCVPLVATSSRAPKIFHGKKLPISIPSNQSHILNA